MNKDQIKKVEEEATDYANKNNSSFSCGGDYYEAFDDLKESFTYGAQFGYKMAREWVKVEIPYEDYQYVLFLFQDGDVRKGFFNCYKQPMLGNQGRWAARHNDYDNPITHYLPAPPTFSDEG